MRIYGVVLISLLAGILIGAVVGYTVRDVELRGASITTHLPGAEITDRNDVASAPSPQKHTENVDSHDSVQSLKDISTQGSSFDQDLSLLLLLARADINDLDTYILQSDEISSNNQRIAILSYVFRRYAAIDPLKAIERVQTLNQMAESEQVELVYSIFEEWTASDLDGAVAAIHELPQAVKEIGASAMMRHSDHLPVDQRIELARAIGPNDVWIEFAIDRIRSEAFKDDPRKAYYDVVRNGSTVRERTHELSEIGEYWIKSAGVTILREIYDSIDNANARHNVLNDLIWHAIRNDFATPTSVLHVVSEIPKSQEARHAIKTVFQAWASVDPKASFDASLEFNDQSITDRVRREILFTWASRDAASLYEEALSFPRQFQHAAITNALVQISNDSPQSAIQRAQDLDSRALRTSARDAIVRGWRNHDAKAAFEWLMNNELDVVDQSDSSLWQDTFTHYLEQDFPAARAYSDLYEGEFRGEFIEATAEHLLHSDIDLAIDYIRSVDLEMSEMLLSQIAYSLTEHNGIEALSFGESVVEEQQDTFYQNLVYGWSHYDFVGLFENIHRVPPEYQSLAASRLIHINSQHHHLSAKELKKLESMVSSEKTSTLSN